MSNSVRFDPELAKDTFKDIIAHPFSNGVAGWDDINEYGTEIYVRTVQIGYVKDEPLYFDVRLRYNEKEHFVNASSADEENKCWSTGDEEVFYPVPDDIADIVCQKVINSFLKRRIEIFDKKPKNHKNIDFLDKE